MSLWQKLTVDWPARCGDWLWELLVVETAKRLEGFTFRRLLFLALLIVVALGLAQAVSMDVAWLLAGDVAFYLEALTIISLVAARGHFLHIARAVTVVTKRLFLRTWRLAHRSFSREHRSKGFRPSHRIKKDDDAPAPLRCALVFA